jgi:hypothetical protein
MNPQEAEVERIVNYPTTAFNKLTRIFDGMLELRESAEAPEKLKVENEALDAFLDYLLDMLLKP